MKASISSSRKWPNAPLRRQLRRLVGDQAEDGDVLGQHLAVVELQRRHIALGIDLVVVAAVLGPLGLEVDLDPVELEARLVQGDVVGEAAGAGGEIELHGGASLG